MGRIIRPSWIIEATVSDEWGGYASLALFGIAVMLLLALKLGRPLGRRQGHDGR